MREGLLTEPPVPAYSQQYPKSWPNSPDRSEGRGKSKYPYKGWYRNNTAQQQHVGFWTTEDAPWPQESQDESTIAYPAVEVPEDHGPDACVSDAETAMALNAFAAIAGNTAEEAEQSEGLTEALQLQYAAWVAANGAKGGKGGNSPSKGFGKKGPGKGDGKNRFAVARSNLTIAKRKAKLDGIKRTSRCLRCGGVGLPILHPWPEGIHESCTCAILFAVIGDGSDSSADDGQPASAGYMAYSSRATTVGVQPVAWEMRFRVLGPCFFLDSRKSLMYDRLLHTYPMPILGFGLSLTRGVTILFTQMPGLRLHRALGFETRFHDRDPLILSGLSGNTTTKGSRSLPFCLLKECGTSVPGTLDSHEISGKAPLRLSQYAQMSLGMVKEGLAPKGDNKLPSIVRDYRIPQHPLANPPTAYMAKKGAKDKEVSRHLRHKLPKAS